MRFASKAMRAILPTLTRRALPKLHPKLLPRLAVATLVTDKPRLPYEGVRIVEKASLLSGRLAGLLFADQGAEVLVLDPAEGEDVDSYLNRGKIAISESDVALDSADIIIVDGEDNSIARLPHQIMMRTVVALPGDARFGHLPHDIDEDYLSAITGFFTDMDMMGWLDRPVTYTPLKLCSIYAGLIGANACAAALVDRLRCGQGREIHASRIAGGLSAIGALCLKQTGLPAHLEPVPAIYKSTSDVLARRKGIEAHELEAHKQAAIADPAKQAWLFQRLYPFMAPYKCKVSQPARHYQTRSMRHAVHCNTRLFVSAHPNPVTEYPEP